MSASSIPLFGRAYSLTILTDPDEGGQQEIITYSSSQWEPEALRITFEVEQQMRWCWTANISIYNLNTATEQAAITQGCEVKLYAGYQATKAGLVFRGKVFQPMWERENVVDYKVTLRCFAGLEFLQNNFVSAFMPGGPYATQAAFGAVDKYFGQIADDNEMDYWAAWDMPALGKLADSVPGDPDITYAPPLPLGSTDQQNAGTTYSIIGTPQQTQQGVTFTVLLDSRLILKKNPPLVVKIDQSQIAQLPLSMGQSFVAPFQQSGLYYVAGVRHWGDSRGGAWYSEVTAVTPRALLTAAQGG